MKTKQVNQDQLDTIINAIRQHEVVAFPTDTVYGIACSPQYLDAIEKMKWVKGRDAEKPFPLMVCSKQQIEEIAWVTPWASAVIEKFMPGALTIILKKKDCIPDEVTNGKDTIAIRMPDDEVVLSLLTQVGPLLVTSANLSGQPAGHTSEEVLAQLEGRISTILVGKSGREAASTIVDCTQEELRILREGPITMAMLKDSRTSS